MLGLEGPGLMLDYYYISPKLGLGRADFLKARLSFFLGSNAKIRHLTLDIEGKLNYRLKLLDFD